MQVGCETQKQKKSGGDGLKRGFFESANFHSLKSERKLGYVKNNVPKV